MGLRLGLDMGTKSIGWCLTEYDDATQDSKGIVDIGVRIFSDGRDPQSGTSLAVDRRDARSARRRRDRFIGRRDAFLETLVKYGLMPADADEAKLLENIGEDPHTPYTLRSAALERRLEPYEIGRALFHLNQRRGFKSNRKAERKQNDPDKGKIAPAAEALDRKINDAGVDTLGQFLHQRVCRTDEEGKPDPLPARVRMNSDAQGYDFYPQRRHYIYEFQRIWDEQAKHFPALMTQSALTWEQLEEMSQREDRDAPTEARDALYRVLFFQRRLKEQKVGLCLFAGRYGIPSDELRLAKAHPLFQERRLYEEVNQLRITTPGAPDEPLNRDQRELLVRRLKLSKSVKFDSLAKLLKLQHGQNFNKASQTRTELAGDEIYASMANKDRFSNRWPNLNCEEQWEIVERVQNEENPDTLHAYLIDRWKLTEAQADAVAKVSLPEGYGRLGETATRLILEEHKKAVITYNQAVERAFPGGHHSDFRTGEILPQLPYYGELLTREIPPGSQLPSDPPEKRWGKITNPTVHIGLRQLEKLVNAVIKVHGRPDQIVVELARELKLNEEEKDKENQRIRKDTLAAQARSRKLLGEDADGNQIGERIADDTGANRMKLRMWEESGANPLDRFCPYCDSPHPISVHMLFTGQADVDHIIPYSRSLDDSVGNKVVAHRGCNRDKGNKTPWERWGDTDRWDAIGTRVAKMHRSKQWRFGPDAMSRVEGEKGFIARQLTDTQYLSRLTGQYLTALYPEAGERHVFMNTGRMTAMLRRLWALNDVLGDSKFVDNKNSNAPKNRLDHRHHAIDGFVMSVMTPSLINKVAQAAGRAEHKDLDRQFENLPEPWPGYLPELRTRLEAVTVSHKADHGRKGKPKPGHDTTAGRLHNDTAYGLTGEVAADGRTPIVVHRVPLTSLKPGDIASDDRIADPTLRAALQCAMRDVATKDLAAALDKFSRSGSQEVDKNGDRLFKGLRHVRVREPLNVIPIRNKSGRAYKAYKGDSNARFDVWRMPDGKWVSDIVPTFDAHQANGSDRRPHPAAKKVLSLRQNDMLAIEREGEPARIVRVVKFSGNGQIALATDNEAGPLKARDASANDLDPFKYVLSSGSGLKRMKARQVRIDPLGRVFDPGPR